MPDRQDPMESHWAVAAIDGPRRQHALSFASRRWDAPDAPDADATPADASLVEALADVATAYDLAAIEALLAQPDPGGLADLAATLRPSAEIALKARAALPPSALSAGGVAFHRLHLAALAIVADRTKELLARMPRILASPPLAGAHAMADARDEGTATLREHAATIWVQLLLASDRPRLANITVDIGNAREALSAEQQRTPASASAFERHSVAALLGAAGDLTTYLQHGEPANVIARVTERLRAARASAPSDATLGIIMAWLTFAAAEIAHRRSTQLSLPDLHHT
jgi:hypothetical protein